MDNLYLIFFLIGCGLFLGIVLYSVFQKKQNERAINGDTTSYIDHQEVEPEVYKTSTETTVNVEPKIEKVTLADSHSRIVDPPIHESVEQAEPAPSQKPKADAVPLKTVAENDGSSTKNTSNLELTVKEKTESEVGLGLEKRPAKLPTDTYVKPKIDKKTSTVITELVAKIKNPLPIEQQELLTLFRLYDYKFNRNVHIFGLNQLTEQWRDIEFELPSARFVELGVSIQLADREGSMTEKELHDFQQMVLAFTTKFDAPFEFSMGIDEAFEQGQILDVIGRRYDSMAVLNIASKTPNGFRAADLGSCARDLMMSSDKNGIYLKTIGQKNNISVLYRLASTDGAGHLDPSNIATTVSHDLVMYMNVPATKEPAKVFAEMIKDANSLATWLEGKVVDRNRHAMTDRSYSVLMKQIVDITASMQKDGLKPGDAVSKLLF